MTKESDKVTIALAWVGTRSDGRQDLYFASDSRTRGVRVFDMSPKVMLLPRTDSAICFAGDTSATYALMLQIANTIAAHEPARERNLDIAELKTHLLRVLTDVMGSVRDASEELTPDDVQFIFGGYSWRAKDFRLWTIYYEKKSKAFRARESYAFHRRLEKAAFIGDWAGKYRHKLMCELRLNEAGPPANTEPLRVLARLLRQVTIRDTIGGAPQLVRVGPHMNSRPLCVLWGDEPRPHLYGRPLFSYENCDYWIIDPDNGRILKPRNFFGPAEGSDGIQAEAAG